MNIFYDENIPYAQEFFEHMGTLIPFAGRTLTAEHVKNADVLLVRSVTPVNQHLLRFNSQLKFVGTATIGFDHIDSRYLQQQNIAFTNAPGCNAISVAEYVLSTLMVLSERLNFNFEHKTVGIVGAGNTGSRLSEKLSALNISHCLHDPLLEQSNDTRNFVTFEEILQCDIISLHVPITTTGLYPTHHLFNFDTLSKLSKQQILINACRGEVIDNQALLQFKIQTKGPELVLDTWENEPNILEPLIAFCQIGTAHIAGYSLEGKARGTEMLYQALSKQLNIDVTKQLSDYLPIGEFAVTPSQSRSMLACIRQRILDVYDVRRDDAIFRTQLQKHSFDYLRKNYPVRREFSALELSAQSEHWPHIIKNLGYNLKS